MKELTGIWEKVLADIRSAVPEREYSLWIGPLTLTGARDSEALIVAPNKFIAQWAAEHYLDLILRAFQRHTNNIERVRITHAGPMDAQPSARTKPPRPLFSNVKSSLTFSSFLATEDNKLAFELAKAVSHSPGQIYNPLYLFCKHPAGKTHLLHAIGNVLLARADTRMPLYISCSEKENLSYALRGLDPQKIAAILIDDLEQFNLTSSQQERFTFLLDKMQCCGVQMVFAAKVVPSAISGISRALRSRLEAGVICPMERYDVSARCRILTLRAPGKAPIPEELAQEIAISSEDIKECMHNLVRVQAVCSLKRLPINRETIRAALSHGTGRGEATAVGILQATSTHFNIPIEDLLSKRRGRSVRYPRKVAIYLLRTVSRSSSNDIARIFSFKDPSPVYRALTDIRANKQSQSFMLQDLAAITRAVTGAEAATPFFD